MEPVKSKNNVNIRLPDERWRHITEEHSELAGYYYDVLETVACPDYIYKGINEELLAVIEIITGKYLVVIYHEFVDLKDGFIITAFFTNRKKSLEKRELIWKK
jgi:hypothetical protein